MTDKQKQALLLITRLYNENKIGDGELCLLHECIFQETATYVPYYPPYYYYPPQPIEPTYTDSSSCDNGDATEERRDMNQQHKEGCDTHTSDVEIPESILREIKDKKFQGD